MDEGSGLLDADDRAFVRALQVAPRAPFGLLGDVLGYSEATAARRYRRLRRDGLLRVTAVVSTEALGQTSWIVRIRCRPSGAAALAEVLAQRDDVTWVFVAAGGVEVVGSVRSRTAQARDDLFLRRLPRSTPVLGFSVAMELHRFVGRQADDWTGLQAELTARQEAALRATLPPSFDEADRGLAAGLDPGDEAIVRELVRDGRATYSALAAAAGISQGRATRRLQQLLGRGIVGLDLDLAPAALGLRTQAQIWLTVVPSAVRDCGAALAAMPEVPFAAATTGVHTVAASVMCRSHEHLYELTTGRIGAVAGIAGMEITPVGSRVKQAGSFVEGQRVMR